MAECLQITSSSLQAIPSLALLDCHPLRWNRNSASVDRISDLCVITNFSKYVYRT